MKEYDLNIWYPEDYDPSTGETSYSMTITVQAYVIEDHQLGHEGPMIELTPEETEILRIQMPEWEYQDDWWYGLEGFLKDIAIPPRLQEFFDKLPSLQTI
jgi:hypothetical protein